MFGLREVLLHFVAAVVDSVGDDDDVHGRNSLKALRLSPDERFATCLLCLLMIARILFALESVVVVDVAPLESVEELEVFLWWW